MKYRVVHKRKIKEIRELTRRVHLRGHGKDEEYTIETLGFAALLDPGYDMFFLGETHPGFRPGQSIKLILEGTIPDANTPASDAGQHNKDASDR